MYWKGGASSRIETVPEQVQPLKLLEKNSVSGICNMFEELKGTTPNVGELCLTK